MKIGVCLILIGIVLIGVLSVVCAEVRINEVELNPNDSCNDCTEWLELYSDSEINLAGWHLSDASGKNQSFNFTITGYYIMDNLNISLNNANEQLFLYNESILVQNTSIISDSSNDNQTWQYCNGNWTFRNSTRGTENNCATQTSPPTCTPSFSCSNSSCSGSSLTQTCYNITSGCQSINTTQILNCETSGSGISIDLDWNEDDIINGDEFNITVSADNLQDKDYDIMVWIADDDGNILSQRYGNYSNGDTKWVAGSYWIYGFFPDNNEDSKKITLRIKDDYSDFTGDATIYAKIRENGKTSEIDNIDKAITVLEENSNNDSSTSSAIMDAELLSTNYENNPSSNDNEIIVLSGSSKTTDEKSSNGIIYKSKIEYIKDYAPYLFGALCIFIIILLMIDKNKGRIE